MKTPNFNDPRVLARVKKSLRFVEQYIKAGEIRQLSSTLLYKHFGNTSRPLNKWLKEMLLTETDPYYNSLTKVCKKYTRNADGFKKVQALVNCDYEVPPELEEQFETGNFVYENKSNRDFTPAQFIPKRIRIPLAAKHGMKYQYDIQAAAPRLLLQKAKQLNPSLVCPELQNYINNRSLVRKQLADECEISPEKVKLVINAILQGGKISSWTQNKIFAQLNFNYDSVKKLNNNPTIISLKADIKSMWDSLRGEFPQVMITDKNGKQLRKRLTSKQKSQLYRDLEEEVGFPIKKLLKKNKIKYLWLHDGWQCDQVIDPNLIVNEVRRQTGLVLELEWTIYED